MLAENEMDEAERFSLACWLQFDYSGTYFDANLTAFVIASGNETGGIGRIGIRWL